MKQQVRELLVTTKVAEQWKENFDDKVEELMALVNKVDSEKQVLHVSELLDVYHKTRHKPRIKRKKLVDACCEKPFEFLVFRN
jgi:hypothetical protein